MHTPAVKKVNPDEKVWGDRKYEIQNLGLDINTATQILIALFDHLFSGSWDDLQHEMQEDLMQDTVAFLRCCKRLSPHIDINYLFAQG